MSEQVCKLIYVTGVTRRVIRESVSSGSRGTVREGCTTCGGDLRRREGRRASSLTPGLSHRQVPGQCGGGDTQSRCSRLSRPTDLRRACSSADAAAILGARVWISFSSSFMRASTSRRLRAPREWRLVGEGECQRRLRDGRGGLEEGEFCGAGGTSIRCSTTRGSVVGRGTVWAR